MMRIQQAITTAKAPETSDVLVIVAKYPHPGAVKTRLGAAIGYQQSAMLYRAFLTDLVARFNEASQRGGYALRWACAPGAGALCEIVGADARVFAQRGEDFAGRLYHIALDMRASGYRRLVIMSSDSPHLSTSLVGGAFELAAPGRVVLGPAEDGGYYLIGLNLTAGVPDLFRGIEMSTLRVLAETLARAKTLELHATLLPTTFDVDEVDDLDRLAAELARVSAPACPHTKAALAKLGFAAVAAVGARDTAARDIREDEALHV